MQISMIDGPFIFFDQRQHAFEPAQPDDRIDLEMRAHVGGAVEDAFSSVRVARA